MHEQLNSYNPKNPHKPHNPKNPHNPHNPSNPHNPNNLKVNSNCDLINETKSWLDDSNCLATCLYEKNNRLLINKELWIKCLIYAKRRDTKKRENIITICEQISQFIIL